MPEQYLHSPSELFTQLATGSQVALNKIMLLYEKILFQRIEQILHSRELSKEVLSDTIHALWLNKEDVAQKSNPVAWLIVTARHKAINKLRDEKRNATFPLEQFPFIENPARIEFEIESKELKQIIDRAAEKLAPQEKTIYTLGIKHGLGRKEIAQQFDVSENTVKNQLRNAMINLRKHISKMIQIFLA